MFINERGMLLFSVLVPLGLILGFLLLIAHIAWVIQVVWMDARQARSIPTRIVDFVAAAALPVIGFYVAKFLERPPAPMDAQSARSRWLLPTMAALMIAAASAMLQQFDPDSRQWTWHAGWDSIIRAFGALMCAYILLLSVLYMFAQVFGLSRHSLMVTRVHISAMLTTAAFCLPMIWPI